MYCRKTVAVRWSVSRCHGQVWMKSGVCTCKYHVTRLGQSLLIVLSSSCNLAKWMEDSFIWYWGRRWRGGRRRGGSLVQPVTVAKPVGALVSVARDKHANIMVLAILGYCLDCWVASVFVWGVLSVMFCCRPVGCSSSYEGRASSPRRSGRSYRMSCSRSARWVLGILRNENVFLNLLTWHILCVIPKRIIRAKCRVYAI